MQLYPEIEPYDHGMLDVGDGHRVYWEVCGNPHGKPALVVHGGPGSGATPRWRRYFDPRAYRVVLFDQRNCGRSTPLATGPEVDLSTNTTAHLVSDMELLREHLGIDRWLLFGASWGSALGLRYAETYPHRVTEIVLSSVTAGTRREVEWITRDMGRVFPEQWERFRDGVPPEDRDGNLAAAYAKLLAHPDPAVRDKAARDWCTWEDTHVDLRGTNPPSPRYQDPRFRSVFARIVTHYWANDHFLEDDIIVREADRLRGIPGVLINGRLDVSGPPDIAWHLMKKWPDAEHHLIGEGGHGFGHRGMSDTAVEALDRFAGRRRSRSGEGAA
ncbi:MAG TPA: prolyl aminopeptidase [Actinopolymorphaceae bacterium]